MSGDSLEGREQFFELYGFQEMYVTYIIVYLYIFLYT